LRILVPSALLGPFYWVYVDGRLVSVAPETVTAHARLTGPVGLADGWRYDLADRAQDAVTVRGEDIVSINGALSEGDIFQPYLVTVAPGVHEAAVMTRGHEGEAFPFAVMRRGVSVAAGQQATVGLGVPRHFNPSGVPKPRAARIPRCTLDLPQVVADQINDFQADPLVRALSGVGETTFTDGIGQRTVVLYLPLAWGGVREFNAGQLQSIVREVAVAYRMDFPQAFRTSCRSRLSGEDRQNFDQVMESADGLNEQLEKLENLTARLR
jgi:hypothetical protein